MQADAVLDFLLIAGLLKTNKRTGWLLRGIENPESIADHQYRMALAASVAWPASDANSASAGGSSPILVALVHDIAEALVGDFAPSDNISKRDKRVLEAAALRTLRACLGWSTPPALALQAAWEEYEHQTSAAGRFVKQLDKLEMCVQALEYEASASRAANSGPSTRSTNGHGATTTATDGWVQLGEFYEGVSEKLTAPLLRDCFAALQAERELLLPSLTQRPLLPSQCAADEASSPPSAKRPARARSTSRRLKVQQPGGGAGVAHLQLPPGATDSRHAFLPVSADVMQQLRAGGLLPPDIVQRFAGAVSPAYAELIEGALRRAAQRKEHACREEAEKQGTVVSHALSSKGVKRAVQSDVVDWGEQRSGSDADDALLLVCGVLVCFALMQLLME